MLIYDSWRSYTSSFFVFTHAFIFPPLICTEGGGKKTLIFFSLSKTSSSSISGVL